MDEHPSLVLIVEFAAFVLVTLPVLGSKIRPAPLPKYQCEASDCEKLKKDAVRSIKIRFK